MDSLKDEFLSLYRREALDSEDMPEKIIGPYRVEACLKDTKEKQTFLLREKESGKPVLMKRAVRFFHVELSNEYSVLSTLDSECLPHALSFFEDGPYAYLLREYIPGESLYDRVGRLGAMSERQAACTVASVCDCLSFLHCRKPPVIHRDVKPQNVIITPEGKPVLIDLGAARKYRQGALQDTVFMGTQATAAPEQYGFGQTDARCDVYALGMLMIYLLTGDFRTDDAALGGISKPLRGIIGKCIRLDPKRRWVSASTLKAALSQFEKRKPRRFASGFIAGFAAGICVSALSGAICLSLLEAPGSLHAQGGYSALLQGVSATSEPGFGSAQPLGAIAPSSPEATSSPMQEATSAPPQGAAAGSTKSVQFASPLIEKAVRFELDKKDGEPIMPEELANVHQLAICGNVVIEDLNKYDHYCGNHTVDGEAVNSHGSIESLEDLRQLKNLTTLVLDRQNIRDLSPLEGLPLQTLELNGNQIVDLTPLKQCVELESLSVNTNPVKDASSIASLKNLETLDIGFTDITDISDISGLPIRYLDMFDVPLYNYATLKQFAVLESLGVQYAPKEGLQVISSLTRLKSLAVFCCNISSLDTLSSLTNLQSLNLNSNQISDLSNIGDFPKLQFLDVNNNPIQSLKPAKKLLQLHSFHIADSNVPDLSVLLEMPGLHSVGCDRAQADALREMSKDLPFELELQ